MKEVLNYVNLNSIKLLPTTSKTGIKGAILCEQLNGEQNGTFDSLEVLVTEITPLLPSGYRVELLPPNRRYDSDALYIGKERTISENNASVLDAM